MPMRFCFFIDGLDEFSGNHREVIKILERLASTAKIKICVSSRPWNVFEDAYGGRASQSLSFQDLTRNDILNYTKGMFQTHPNWDKYSASSDALLREITKKAQGVFLWVFLVVRSIESGLTNGDSISSLKRRVDEFPQDLEAFSTHMLNDIDPFYHERMARTFKTALQAQEPLSIMVYSLMDQCVESDELALKCPITPMDNHDIFRRRQQMRRRLDGRCKVRDFFLTQEMADFLDKNAPSFDPKMVIFRAYVALVKMMPVKKHYFQSGVSSRIITDAFFYANLIDQEPGYSEVELVDELRYTMEEAAATHNVDIPWERNRFVEFAISKGLSDYLALQPELRPGAEGVFDSVFLRDALDETVEGNDDGPDITRNLWLSKTSPKASNWRLVILVVGTI
ncbi:hypothetical protein ACHAPJ_009472 [Fusarium lateritium]